MSGHIGIRPHDRIVRQDPPWTDTETGRRVPGSVKGCANAALAIPFLGLRNRLLNWWTVDSALGRDFFRGDPDGRGSLRSEAAPSRWRKTPHHFSEESARHFVSLGETGTGAGCSPRGAGPGLTKK
jgi:hypothetical protein